MGDDASFGGGFAEILPSVGGTESLHSLELHNRGGGRILQHHCGFRAGRGWRGVGGGEGTLIVKRTLQRCSWSCLPVLSPHHVSQSVPVLSAVSTRAIFLQLHTVDITSISMHIAQQGIPYYILCIAIFPHHLPYFPACSLSSSHGHRHEAGCMDQYMLEDKEQTGRHGADWRTRSRLDDKEQPRRQGAGWRTMSRLEDMEQA